MGKFQHKVQIIPLGGLGEIGKNMTVFRYGDDMILIDAGLMFPEDDMLGIDLVIPDITYLVENKDKIKGIFLTHGHEDHIGALPYVMKQIDCPVYGTALTLGILQGHLKENGVGNETLHVVKPGDKINTGAFKLDFIRVNHSIPDAVAIAITTPIGVIIHTGDFKIDHTPVDGQVMEFNKFAEYGDRGVLCLLADSTNAERPGFTPSEKMVGQTFDEEFRYAKHRIIVATFSSNVHRIQQVIDTAVKYDRKVAVIGRSMVNVVNIAKELGYLKVPEGVLIDIDETHNYTPEKVVIITTGSQGEPMAGLTRMAYSEHRKLQIRQSDTVIISATPIPGNEKSISRVIDQLYRCGANVIYKALAGLHVSGHACQEELKLMHALVKPKYFIPVHGEYRMLWQHAVLAESMGMNSTDIVLPETGQVIEMNQEGLYLAEQIPTGAVLVDGLGIGDVGNVVLRDRKHLSQDGLIIVVMAINRDDQRLVSGPDIISRGFIYVRENEDIIENTRDVVRQILAQSSLAGEDWPALKNRIKDELHRFIFEKIKRNPMILPIILDV